MKKRTIEELEAEIKEKIGSGPPIADLDTPITPKPFDGENFVRLAKEVREILEKNSERNPLPNSS